MAATLACIDQQEAEIKEVEHLVVQALYDRLRLCRRWIYDRGTLPVAAMQVGTYEKAHRRNCSSKR